MAHRQPHHTPPKLAAVSSPQETYVTYISYLPK